ncbi:MAG: DUF1385 domain-containing protein [Actinomycetota bacterium]
MERLRMGGQAVLEGVMMRSPRFIAVAVRKPDGTIATMHERIDTFFHRSPPFKLFPLRGVVSLTEMFLLGLKALSFSAQEASGEEEDFGTKEIALSFIFAFVFVTLLFILLPAYLSGLTHIYVSATWLRSLVEGVLRVTIFLIYIVAVSRMHDIKRVFQYHGAEHKTVHAYEHGEELKPDVIQRYSPLHVGCGTGYLLTVMVVAIFVFAFIPRTSLILRVLIQLLLIPVISTVTFEIIRLARRFEGKTITRVLMAPGLFLQKLTAREPDDSQIEVAVTALKEAVRLEEEA